MIGMATKNYAGVIGLRVNFVDKITYVHKGEGIEERVLEWCREQKDWRRIRRLALAMKRVTGEPTDDQILEYCINTGIDIPTGSPDWYEIMRPNQGDLSRILAGKFYKDYKEFMVGSLFCKFAIIINLDRMELEVYGKTCLDMSRYRFYYMTKCIDLRKL